MIIPRRPPWYGRRHRPTEVDPDVDYGWVAEGDDVFGDSAAIYPERRLFQKIGYVDDIVRSESAEFRTWEWENLIGALWVEIVTLDWCHALRARVADLVPQKAEIRRAGVDIVQVYLPVFRADRLQTLGDLK